MNQRSAAWFLSVALFCYDSQSVLSHTATAQHVEFVAAELGGVSVISIPQPSPLPGLLATKVVLRTDAENQLVTYENIQLTGAVHQTFIPGVFGGPPTPTPFVHGIVWDFLPPEWIAADSHLLISPSMVQGEAGGGFTGISEVNDSGNPAGASELLPRLGGISPALTGIGSIAMGQSTDAFFVAAEFQTNEIDLAYVVTPDDSTGAAGDVFLTFGVLGLGIIDSGQPGGANFGFNGVDPIAIPFIPVSQKPWITLATVGSPVQFGESVTLSAVTASSVDIAAVEFFANDEPIPSCSFTTQPYECEWTPSLPGSYDMTARATDVDGGVGNAPSWNLRVQGEPPLITIATESNSILEGDSVTLSADATAQMGEIATVLFFAHDLVIPDCRLNAAPYVCEWTPRSAGPYDVWARAIDSFGGVGDSERTSVFVESIAPSVALTANRTSVPRGYGITLAANATARVGEITSVEFFSDGQPIPGCRLVAAPYECEWVPDRAGSYNITARATDDSGKVGDSSDTQLSVLAPFTWLSSAGMEVVFTPDPKPLLDSDLLAGTLSVESLDGSEILTLDGISMRDLHHVGVQQPTGVGPTVTAADHRNPAHSQYDSHLLVTPDMIADSVGVMLQETGFDDPTAVDPAGVQNRIPADMLGNPAHTYRGDIVHGGEALSLRPEFRADSVNVARLVGRPGDVSRIQLDVLGDFNGAGNFEFEIGWTQPVGNPPVIQFDAPSFVQGGTSVTLSALASDTDGDLALVEFFDNGVPIPTCTFTEGPYECAWKPTDGSHKLRATATDENGNRVRSEAAQVSVEPPPEFVVAELGGVEVISIPQPSPLPGLLATKVVLRTDAGKLVTYENIQITGAVHQTFLPGAFGAPPQPSPYVDAAPFWHVVPPEWIEVDSHILISPSMVGGAGGAGLFGISETNDFSNPAGANESLPFGVVNGLTGIGDISMEQSTDAFFVNSEFQTNEIDLAYLVTPDNSTGAEGDVFLTVGVLGDGIIASGRPGGASFGFNGNDPVVIPFGTKPLIALKAIPSPVEFGETISLSAVASGPGDIVSVDFFANDEAIPGCSFVSIPYQCEWTPSLPGSYNMTARATDVDGKVGISADSILRVEGDPPLITLAAEPSSILEGDSLNLSADATAQFGEIASVQFFANDVEIPNCRLTATPYICEWTPDVAGTYDVWAQAIDNFGGIGDSDRSSVFVESAAPLVAITANRTSVPRGYGVTLSANATAKVGELASVEFLSDGEPIPGCRFVTAPYECEWLPDRAGSYNITARATDDSGKADSAETQLNVLAPFTWLSSEGVEVVFTPDPQPLLDGDLLGGTLSVESLDGSEVTTIGGISMRDLHHVGVQQPTGVGPTVTAADHRDATHAQYDSHLLVTPEMIIGSAGSLLQETGFDDPAAVDPAGVQNRIPPDMLGNPAHTYRGDLVHGGGTLSLRPEFRAESVNVARLVGRPGDVSRIRFDALGDFSGTGNFEFEIGWTQPLGNPPTIQFDAPALIEGGTTVTLAALASDTDGDITSVEFFDNGVPITACTFTEGPYECAWKPTSGSHKLRVTATDESGNRVRSEAAQVFVEPPLESVIAELGGVEVILIPQPSPLPGLSASKVVLRAAADNKLVTFENLKITGAVHQISIPGAFGGPPLPTPFVDAPVWNVLPSEWIEADSHLLISPSMVGGGTGASFSGISETNDLSNPAGANESLPLIGGQAPAVTGIGDIAMQQPTDAFFLTPEFQANEIELAYVVTPDDSTGDVFITVGVLGEGIINSGEAGGASFGINGNDPVAIPFGSSRPLIALTTVPSAAVLGETIDLSALATASSGEIVSVEFFADDEPIQGCRLVALPYECAWTPSAIGSFNIIARATDDSGTFGDSRAKQFNVLSPLTVSLSSPPQTGPVKRALLTDESLTLAADVVHALGEAIVSVEFVANDELIQGCSFTVEPYVCEWTPDEGEHMVLARAEDAVGNIQDSPLGFVSVFPQGTGGIGDDLPRDEDGNIIVAEEFHMPGGFGGPPIPIVIPGAPVDPLPLFVVLPTDESGPINLLTIEEIADDADMFSYAGDPPPLRFESQEVRVGPFDVEPRGGGKFSAMYALAFDDGSRVVATISANVIPEPGTLVVSIICLMGLIPYRRRKPLMTRVASSSHAKREGERP